VWKAARQLPAQSSEARSAAAADRSEAVDGIGSADTAGATDGTEFRHHAEGQISSRTDPAVDRRDHGNSIQRTRSTPMSNLIAIVYPSEAKAEEVRQRLFKLQREYLIKFSDAVIAVKTDAGPVKLNQLVNTTAAGAASGSFWGLLVGLLFLNPIIGVALGAASGALGGALTDYGINDAFMKELSATLQPGKAALFVLVQEMTTDKVLKGIQDAGGTVLQTSLDDSKEKMLRDALAKATVTAPEATNPA
jgi:uncharacterized membrane protein